MPGSALKLGGAITNPIFGKLAQYEGATPGTLMLWDADFADAAGTPLPANGAAMANLMRDQAASITGLTAADCDFHAASVMTTFAGGERTAKGGIHIAATQSGNQNASEYFVLQPNKPLADWVLANIGAGGNHCLLTINWMRCTRAQIASGVPVSPAYATAFSNGAANYLYHEQGGIGQPATYAKQDFALTLGNIGVMAVASSGWTGTKPGAGANYSYTFWGGGTHGAWGSLNYNKAPSLILYRHETVLVDLSDAPGDSLNDKITGLLAEQQAMFDRDFGDGGRFYGDTWTDPATLASG